MIFMTIVTIWALFGDDIRRLAAEKPADEAFVVLIICLIGFGTFRLTSEMFKAGPGGGAFRRG